jgi:hypothetical protein
MPKIHTNVRADEDVIEAVAELAERERRSFSQMLQILLEEALSQRKKRSGREPL